MESIVLTNSLLIALLALSAARTGVFLYEAYCRAKEAKRVVRATREPWKF